jgi:prevent-host-death family protein
MSKLLSKKRRSSLGAEEARAHLPELLEKAHHGTATVITKRGRPYAALVPIQELTNATAAVSLMSLRGSGAGLWGSDAAQTIAALRDEWA